MQKTLRFKLGSDPELFLLNKESGQLHSAIPVIPEGKSNPRPLGALGNAVLHDNVLIEFNTTPAEDRDSFVNNIGEVLKDIDTLVQEQGAQLHLQASADFPEDQLKDPEAREFGCDPDFDAYALCDNVIDAKAATLPFRSAGGHLHIGYHESDEELKQLLDDPYGKVKVVKGLDLFVGMISVFLDTDESAPARRALYGKAGAHRPKPYGVEYRACSAWWLASPKHTELVYNLSARALEICLDEQSFTALIEAIGGEDKLQEVINKSEREIARNLYKEHLEPLLDEETIEMINTLDNKKVSFRAEWDL